MRLELSLELDRFRLEVPDNEYLVMRGLHQNVGVFGAPADRGYALVRKSQQALQLERLLVVDVHCQGRRERELVPAARQDLLLPDLNTGDRDFLQAGSTVSKN